MAEMKSKSVLLSPFDLRGLRLKNRIVMAPLTRSRAGERRLPNALMAEYYTQRAAAGLDCYGSHGGFKTGNRLAQQPGNLYR